MLAMADAGTPSFGSEVLLTSPSEQLPQPAAARISALSLCTICSLHNRASNIWVMSGWRKGWVRSLCSEAFPALPTPGMIQG